MAVSEVYMNWKVTANRTQFYQIIPIFLSVLIFLSGCTNPGSDAVVLPRIRASLNSTGSGSIKAAVYAEGPDGNALTGALVTVSDSRNVVYQLGYDSASCSYNRGSGGFFCKHG